MTFYSKNDMLNMFASATSNPDVILHLGLESREAPGSLKEEPANVAEYIKVLKKDGAEAVARIAYKPETIDRLVRDSRKGVREIIARNPNVTMDQMEALFEKCFRGDNTDDLASTQSAFNYSFRSLEGDAFERALHTFMAHSDYSITLEAMWHQGVDKEGDEKFEDLPEELRSVVFPLGPLAALISYRKEFMDLEYALKIWKEFQILEPLFGFVASYSWKFEEGAAKLREAGVPESILTFILTTAPLMCTRNTGVSYYGNCGLISSVFAVRMTDAHVSEVLNLHGKYPRLGRMIRERYEEARLHNLREYFLFASTQAIHDFQDLDMAWTRTGFGSRYMVMTDDNICEIWQRAFARSDFSDDVKDSFPAHMAAHVARVKDTVWIFQRINQIVRDDMRTPDVEKRENVARAILHLLRSAQPSNGVKLSPEAVGYLLGASFTLPSCNSFVQSWAAGHRKGQPAKAADISLALQVAATADADTEGALNDAVARLYPFLVNSDQRRVPEIEGRSVCGMSMVKSAHDTWSEFLHLAARMANEYLGADPIPWSMAAELAVNATPELTVAEWFETSLAIAGAGLSDHHDGTGLGDEDDAEDDYPQYETLRLFE